MKLRFGLRFDRRRSWLFCGLRKRRRRLAPGRVGAERFGGLKAGAQTVLVKAVAGPGAAEPGTAATLDFGNTFLRGESGLVELRVLAGEFAEGQRFGRGEGRVEADEERLVGVDAL